MRRSFAFLACMSVAAIGPLQGCAKARAQSMVPSAYDTRALMSTIRPEFRPNLTKMIGVPSLDVLPLYDLQIGLDHAGASFTLHENVSFTNTESQPLREIVFRLYANETDDPTGGAAAKKQLVSLLRGSCGAPNSCTVTQDAPSVVTVKPTFPIAPGGRLHISMELHGTLERIESTRTNMMAQGMESLSMLGAGEGMGDFGLLAIGDGIASMANFYPVLARRRNGAWERSDDTPIGDVVSDELCNVHARIETTPDVKIATTGATTTSSIVQRSMGDPRKQIVDVNAAAVRDFALIAGPELEHASRAVNGVEVRSHFLASERAAGEHVLDVAAHALEQYERRFGPYPYTELDVCEAAIVGGAGGVEFSGLVTIASMFYRPFNGANGSGQGLAGLTQLLGASGNGMEGLLTSMREFVTAHEVAHQFWHGLVGSDSRLHPFVDEGLAQYTAMLYLEDRYGADRAKNDGNLQIKANFQMMRMMGVADSAVDQPASAFKSPLAYAGLVYGKGPYVYDAIRKSIGDKAFFDGLRAYVEKYRFKLAPARGLIETLAQGSQSASVQAIARRWLDESHGDEDLGQLDLGALASQVLGNGQALDPQMQQMLQSLAPMLNGQNGNGGANPLQQLMQGLNSNTPGASNPLQQLMQNLAPQPPGQAPSNGTQNGIDPQMLQMLQQLMQGGNGAGIDPAQMQQMLQSLLAQSGVDPQTQQLLQSLLPLLQGNGSTSTSIHAVSNALRQMASRSHGLLGTQPGSTEDALVHTLVDTLLQLAENELTDDPTSGALPQTPLQQAPPSSAAPQQLPAPNAAEPDEDEDDNSSTDEDDDIL